MTITLCRDNPLAAQYRRADGCLVVNGPRSPNQGLMPLSDMAGNDAARRVHRMEQLGAGSPMLSWLNYGCGHNIEQVRDWRGHVGWDPACCTPEPEGHFDLVTLFHVIEHVDDGAALLRHVVERFTPNVLVVETPNANDWMLACDAYRRALAWTDHRIIYTAQALAGLLPNLCTMSYVQRYPVGNALRWLRHGKPGGHRDKPWCFIGKGEHESYEAALGEHTDTLWAEWRLV